MSKKFKISTVIFIIFSILITNIAFADENINITITQNTDSTVNISINSQKNIEKVRIYTKREGEEYHLFYESHLHIIHEEQSSTKEKPHAVSL